MNIYVSVMIKFVFLKFFLGNSKKNREFVFTDFVGLVFFES